MDNNARVMVGIKTDIRVNIYFSDYFQVDPQLLEDYGAFNISLVNDLPLFIDPFLLFNSEKEEYQQLHDGIIRYLRFLRDKSTDSQIDRGLLLAWFRFKELKQTWLGFSRFGNKGSGLGLDFAVALNENLARVFSNFGKEHITKGSHLEKLCLINAGVGRDNISDFSTNLIKEYLLDFTQRFALDYISPDLRIRFRVPKVRFNYQTERWESDLFELPLFEGDYVILTPVDMLTRDTIWINREDLVQQFREISESVPNDQLRSELNNYLISKIPRDANQKEINAVQASAYRVFPELLEYYIKYKEDHGDEAEIISETKVEESKLLLIDQVIDFIIALSKSTGFYQTGGDTLLEAYNRVMFMKHVIEDQDGYRLFYINNEPVRRERDVQLIFKFTWFASPSDINAEVNTGRGPVDFKASRGAFDKSLIEFKLASNTHLKRNLQNQVEVYKRANDTDKALKVIVYFSEEELRKVKAILDELGLKDEKFIILIDARADNKPSASKA
jgi:hypothetical protein